MKSLWHLILALLPFCMSSDSPLQAQQNNFLGALAGISTLSADGQTEIGGDFTNISLYKPENGPSGEVLGGRHLNNYVSLQGSYVWNRNDLTLTSSQASAQQLLFYEQSREATTHSVIGEVLVYMRRRKSFIRPYLSVGGGLVRVTSGSGTLINASTPPLPTPDEFSSDGVALRVAVGVDFVAKSGWAFRFIFSETIRTNAISRQLTPPGGRNLANFQNLFGVVKYF